MIAALLGAALAGALSLTSPEAPAPTGALRLVFPALTQTGQVVVAVFDDPRHWRTQSHPLRSVTVEVKNGSAEVSIDRLTPGAFGVMAFHDRNANGRLDTGMMGLPLEPYGFSNNARATFGPPGWASAKVEVHAGESVAQAIHLH